MTRMSARITRVLPRRMNSRSSSTRSSLACTVGAISPTSSRNSTPPAACSMRPGLVATAPVNAPRSWPKSSDSSSWSGSAAQLMAMNGPWLRREAWWRKRATTSLPVPDSPVSSTVVSVCATRVACASTSFHCLLCPTTRRTPPRASSSRVSVATCASSRAAVAARLGEVLVRQRQRQVVGDAAREVDVVLGEAVDVARREEERAEDAGAERQRHPHGGPGAEAREPPRLRCRCGRTPRRRRARCRGRG